MVGSIEKRKGHDILLKSIEKLDKETRNKIHIIFCGSDKNSSKDNLKWLLQIENSTNTSDIITHIEYQDPIEIYQMADIFCLPSRQEGFALVVIEAMLAKCCIIRSDTEGATEQITHGKTGYIFKKNNVDELTALINNLVSNPDLIKNISIEAQKSALEKFTTRQMTINTLNVYNKI